VTGTEPGINLLGTQLPLNQDAWFNYLLANPLSPVFVNGAGYLSAQGTAEAEFHLPPLVGSGIIEEITFHHAFIVAVNGQIPVASEAVPLQFAQFAP
jgi:hypothetical protein